MANAVLYLMLITMDHLPQNLRHDLMRFGLQRAATSAVSLRPQVDTCSPTVSMLLSTAYAPRL